SASLSQLTVTSLLVWVVPRLSTKVARSVSVPGVAPTKLNEALPEAFVGLVPGPVNPASGPLTTLKVTLVPATGFPTAFVTVAVTVAVLQVWSDWLAGLRTIPEAWIAMAAPAGCQFGW